MSRQINSTGLITGVVDDAADALERGFRVPDDDKGKVAIVTEKEIKTHTWSFIGMLLTILYESAVFVVFMALVSYETGLLAITPNKYMWVDGILKFTNWILWFVWLYWLSSRGVINNVIAIIHAVIHVLDFGYIFMYVFWTWWKISHKTVAAGSVYKKQWGLSFIFTFELVTKVIEVGLFIYFVLKSSFIPRIWGSLRGGVKVVKGGYSEMQEEEE